jgi:hypothetical protein
MIINNFYIISWNRINLKNQVLNNISIFYFHFDRWGKAKNKLSLRVSPTPIGYASTVAISTILFAKYATAAKASQGSRIIRTTCRCNICKRTISSHPSLSKGGIPSNSTPMLMALHSTPINQGQINAARALERSLPALNTPKTLK